MEGRSGGRVVQWRGGPAGGLSSGSSEIRVQGSGFRVQGSGFWGQEQKQKKNKMKSEMSKKKKKKKEK